VTKLGALASFVRSKNAGPFMCTIDIFFDDPAAFARVADSGCVTPAAVAGLYGIPEGRIEVFRVDSARAMKVSFPRRLQAGDPGDTDITAGQQFAPILDLAIADPVPLVGEAQDHQRQGPNS
jgi:hypothetical protein